MRTVNKVPIRAISAGMATGAKSFMVDACSESSNFENSFLYCLFAQRLALCPCGVLVCLDRLDNQAGRGDANLTEPTSSHATCLKTRRLVEGAFECDRTCPRSEADGIAHPGALAPGIPPWPRSSLLGFGCGVPG
jgi:hypothetical protein